MQMVLDVGGGSLADADDAQLFGAEHGDVQMGHFDLQCNGGQEASAAAAEDQHIFHWLIRRADHRAAPVIIAGCGAALWTCRSNSSIVNPMAALRRQAS